MNWDDVREMPNAGMSFGLHMHTHRILSQLRTEDQLTALVTSRDIVTKQLDRVPLAISYPVGDRGAFTEETRRLADKAGYRLGLSFMPGAIGTSPMNPFALPRYAVDEIRDKSSL